MDAHIAVRKRETSTFGRTEQSGKEKRLRLDAQSSQEKRSVCVQTHRAVRKREASAFKRTEQSGEEKRLRLDAQSSQEKRSAYVWTHRAVSKSEASAFGRTKQSGEEKRLRSHAQSSQQNGDEVGSCKKLEHGQISKLAEGRMCVYSRSHGKKEEVGMPTLLAHTVRHGFATQAPQRSTAASLYNH